MIRDLKILGGAKHAPREGEGEIPKITSEEGIYSATAIDFSREYESAFSCRRWGLIGWAATSLTENRG
jgi:hypothetical protein